MSPDIDIEAEAGRQSQDSSFSDEEKPDKSLNYTPTCSSDTHVEEVETTSDVQSQAP